MMLVRLALLIVAAILGAGASAPAQTAAVPRDPPGFTAYAARAFAAENPGAKIEATGPLVLALTPAGGAERQISLERIWNYCAGNAGGCAEAIAVYARNLSATFREDSRPIDRSMLRVVVRPNDYADAARRAIAAGKPDAVPVVRPFAGELSLVCVADLPHGITILNRGAIAKLGLSEDEAFALGIRNTAAALPPLKARGPPKKAFRRIDGDDYESSRIVLHDAWAPLAKRGTLVVAVPESHMVLFGDAARPGTTEAMRDFALEVVDHAQRPISKTLFTWAPDGWHPLPP